MDLGSTLESQGLRSGKQTQGRSLGGLLGRSLESLQHLNRPRRQAIVGSRRSIGTRLSMYHSLAELMTAYLETLHGRTQTNSRLVAGQWIRTLTGTPTRKDVLARHLAKGHGHFQAGSSQANTELALLRAACRWGLYQECWEGGDPTVGVKKWKTAKRTRVTKFQEVRLVLDYFARASSDEELRDRAIFSLMLFTGCRPGEARTIQPQNITPYGEMGCWDKGKTKNGQDYEVPIPSQVMPWIDAWKAVRPAERPNPYLFPGQAVNQPLGTDWVVNRWNELRLMLGIRGLWNYDLRRSLATHMSNELKISDSMIDAILGHEKNGSLGKYLHVSFDAMTGPIQQYADWLCGLKQEVRG